MGAVLLFGSATGVALVIGAAVGLRWTLPERVLAALMAFGAGTLIAAASTELFGAAYAVAGVALASGALLAGALVYVLADRVLTGRLGTAALGWALLVGVVLDGVPENMALGVSIHEPGVGVLLAAIIIGNIPESVSGAAVMRDTHGLSHRRVHALWIAAGVLLAAVTVAGGGLSDTVGQSGIAIVQAFAGGAVLAVLANSLMPEAYREGGWWVGIATACGFLTSYLLGGV